MNFDYGNPIVRGFVTVGVGVPGLEYQGAYNPLAGIKFGQAYLQFEPPAFGSLHLHFKVGGFQESFAGPGPWSWGIYGPLLAVRGYGESVIAEHDTSSDIRLNAEHGILGVPGTPEGFVRGNWTDWTQPGASTLVQHAHAGITFRGEYWLKLHFARASGTDERRYLDLGGRLPKDGHLDCYALELRGALVPLGSLGVSGGFWDFKNAFSVHDGIWWGIDWTKGAVDMMRKFVGDQREGNGQVAAISAQYNFSLAQYMWHPRPFDGNAPDVHFTIAGLHHWTLATDDLAFKNAEGFMFGVEVNYQMLSWFGTLLRTYGENRDDRSGRRIIYTVSPGLAFRSDWQSNDRIELIYTRFFYNSYVDNNPAQPLDENAVGINASIGF
jgi:hypothetical protein